MEEELLSEMIRDRETQIALIKKKMEEQTRKFERVTTDLEAIRAELKTSEVDQQVEIDMLVQRHSKLVKDYKEAKEGLDMKKQQQGAQLHLYNEVMKNVATPESRDSSYVMRMQAQLCKAMHSMGMVETQLALATNQTEALQKHLKDVVTVTGEEKSQVELKVMNEMMIADAGRKDAEDKTKEMMDAFTKEKDGLVEKIEREKEEPPEEDDDEEREELMEILVQGREEIERMEDENRAELAKMEELKEKVAAIKGEGFVEEVVNSIVEEFKEKAEAEGSDGEEDED